jgi:1-acyl-sn-glycerol-3-phosphate acyltransferase
MDGGVPDPHGNRAAAWVAAALRRALWRTVLIFTGGLRVVGRMPKTPCVVVANHTSHADTAALLAALPAARRPRVAAGADYWFVRPGLALFCRVLAGGFPLIRTGGGFASLNHAKALLAAGHSLILFPEGTRSRDGRMGRFRSGAGRLADRTGVPIVPIGIVGAREVLPVGGRLRRHPITVRIGAPTTDLDEAREAVVALSTAPVPIGLDPARRRLPHVATALTASPAGLALAFAWAVAEALTRPLVAAVLIVAVAATARFRAVPRRPTMTGSRRSGGRRNGTS